MYCIVDRSFALILSQKDASEVRRRRTGEAHEYRGMGCEVLALVTNYEAAEAVILAALCMGSNQESIIGMSPQYKNSSTLTRNRANLSTFWLLE